MNFFKSLTLTFAMYSKIPMPMVQWDEKSMQWVFPCFPLVGVLVGAVLGFWLRLALWLSLGKLLTGVIALLIPIAISGGIHLDGLCDACDALGSHQPQERKLEIMKDPHIGAFGVMGCVLYLLVFFAVWSEVELTMGNLALLTTIPVVSRSWVALAAVTRRNARGSGLLATFTSSGAGRWSKLLVSLWLVAGLIFLILWSVPGRWVAAASGLIAVWFYRVTEREFGGITGDLAGWYLQMLELGMVLTVALAGRGGI